MPEVEVQDTSPAEAARGLGLGDCANQGCAFGHGDAVIGVVDGFGDDCVNGLAWFRRDGAYLFSEVRVDNPGG